MIEIKKFNEFLGTNFKKYERLKNILDYLNDNNIMHNITFISTDGRYTNYYLIIRRDKNTRSFWHITVNVLWELDWLKSDNTLSDKYKYCSAYPYNSVYWSSRFKVHRSRKRRY